MLAKLLALGSIVYFGQSIAYFSAVTLIPAGLACLLLYIYPAIVTVVAVTFLHERISYLKILALVLALIGVALTLGGPGQIGSIDRRGILLVLVAAVLYASFIVFGTKLLEQAAPLVTSWIVFVSTTVVYGVIILVRGAAWPHGIAGWGGTVGLGLFSTVAVTTLLAGLRLIGPVTTSTLSVFEAVVTVVLAAAVFGDKLTILQLAGGLLILSAAIILARSPAERQVG